MAERRLTLGIDEAGRGPVIGPMVLAAVCLETSAASHLTKNGLRDSKWFGAGAKAKQARLSLAVEIRRVCLFSAVEVVDVAEIDRRVVRGQLNVLEREVAKRLIGRAPLVDRIIADGKTLFIPLRSDYPHLVAWNKGEDKHAAVAAASVLAKTLRDELYEAICQRYAPEFGEIAGGGYVNPRTRQFLRDFLSRHGRLPPEVRRSWPQPELAEITGQLDRQADLSMADRVGQMALL